MPVFNHKCHQTDSLFYSFFPSVFSLNLLHDLLMKVTSETEVNEHGIVQFLFLISWASPLCEINHAILAYNG